MATALKARLRPITVEERAESDRVRKAGSERADRVRPARARLAAAEGESFAQAAARAGLGSGTAVAGWSAESMPLSINSALPAASNRPREQKPRHRRG